MFLGHIRLHKSQRSCPNKLLNAKSKKGRGRTDGRTNERTNGVTLSLLELLIAANKITFVLGDFNINWINCEASIKESEFLKCGFIQLVKEPTHNQGGIIDHCYISKNVIPSSVLLRQSSVYYTDHDILEVEYTNID